MAEERDPNQAESVEDLDVNEDEAGDVKGGRRQAADPCEGGE